MGSASDAHARLAAQAREILAGYGRDYALGALRGLAVRNMVSLDLPAPSPEFYPLVKIHEMALRELEDAFYAHLAAEDSATAADLIRSLAAGRVWE